MNAVGPPSGGFSFQVQGEPGSAIQISLHGELDMAWADPLRKGLAVLLEFRPTSLSYDLRSLTFIDSAGIAYLVYVQEMADKAGIPIWFRLDETGPVVSTMEVAGVLDRLRLSG